MKNEHIRPSIKEVGEERELAGVEKDRDEEIQSRNKQGGLYQEGSSSGSATGQREIEQREVDDMERDEDVRPMKAESTPKTPSPEEYRVHRLTHLPYRSWCPHCVRAKKRNPPHKKKSSKDAERRTVPAIAIDYMYMTNREFGQGNPIVVVKDSENDGVWAFMALRKGAGNTYVAERIAQVINFMGYKRCTIRCDQEPAMRDLQKEIRKEIWKERIQAANEVKELLGSDRIEVSEPKNIETTLENSPVGESQSNGLLERAIQSVQEQVRVIKRYPGA